MLSPEPGLTEPLSPTGTNAQASIETPQAGSGRNPEEFPQQALTLRRALKHGILLLGAILLHAPTGTNAQASIETISRVISRTLPFLPQQALTLRRALKRRRSERPSLSFHPQQALTLRRALKLFVLHECGAARFTPTGTNAQASIETITQPSRLGMSERYPNRH